MPGLALAPCRPRPVLRASTRPQVGGIPPRIIHFTRDKPFGGPRPGALGHQHLCSLQELAARAAGVGSDAAAAPSAEPARREQAAAPGPKPAASLASRLAG